MGALVMPLLAAEVTPEKTVLVLEVLNLGKAIFALVQRDKVVWLLAGAASP